MDEVIEINGGDGVLIHQQQQSSIGLESACRLCLTTENTRSSIFSVPHNAIAFADKIHDCLSIQVESSDKLSTLVCTDCIKKIEQWHSYKETCLQSQEKLQQWLIKQNTVVQPMMMTVKEEPVDVEFQDDTTVQVTTNELNNTNHDQPVENGMDITENHESNATSATDSAVPTASPANSVVLAASVTDSVEPTASPANSAELTAMVTESTMPIASATDNVVPTASPANSAVLTASATDSAVPTASAANSAVPSTSEKSPPKINERIDKVFEPMVQIKCEPIDSEEDDCDVDIESNNSGPGELLLNPMAVGVANKVANKERIMEADSTQKLIVKRYGGRKKYRRGPHTHFRGARLFKKKCVHCKINLHSKHSYTQHMSRYHGIVNSLVPEHLDKPEPLPAVKPKPQFNQHVDNMETAVDTQNDINREDAEFEKMIKTDPLTPVQKNIIGQLKTFSCYTCNQTFYDRRHTLNHIRQHMPDLKPYTCIACLTEFSDRSMYKLHCGASFECAMKIALVIPKVGYEKYFTCNMCLKPFGDRKELLQHLAAHADRQLEQMSKSMISPPKLKPITPASKIHSSPSKRFVSDIPGPYMNGDPAHNHMCNLCGMIYRYKPNMFKHRDLCSTLPDNIRTSYRCVHCSMTYLVYKKFYTHVFYDHKKREITCFTCHQRFATADEYLNHHETHRVISESHKDTTNETSNNQLQQGNEVADEYAMDVDPLNASTHPTDISEKAFNCALCGEDFATKIELTEHRNLHLKVKIYSCVICRSMFSSSSALELHMKEHGIDDAVEQNANSSLVEYGRGNRLKNSMNLMNDSVSTTSEPGKHHCYECGKNFANYANLKRHERNLHTKQRRRWSCDECKRRFKSAEDYEEHKRLDHGIGSMVQSPEKMMHPLVPAVPLPISATTGKPHLQCPKCPKTFAYQGNLILHCQNVHKENHFERLQANAARRSAPLPTPVYHSPPVPAVKKRGHTCDICGKTFAEEQSLKTHRGWHLRSTYRLKADINASLDETKLSYSMNSSPPAISTPISHELPKPAKARKSFPNHPQPRQLNALAASLQCQVCDDRFHDVAELRKHLWDVHCARNKPEKIFTTELQCELCTNKFPNEETLEEHMHWHSDNPILNEHQYQDMNHEEDNADDIVSAEPMLAEEAKKPFYCDTCGKYYSNRKVFLRHKKLHKVLPFGMMNFQSLHQSRRNYCHPCQKNFATEASLKRHKASTCHLNVAHTTAQTHSMAAKKITTTAIVHQPPTEIIKMPIIKREPGLEYSSASTSIPSHQGNLSHSKKKPVTCSVCKMLFPNMSVLYRHKQLMHRGSQTGSGYKSAGQVQLQTECVPLMSNEGLVCCNLCGKQFPGISNLKQHFAHKHKSKSATYPCTMYGCKLVFSSVHSLKAHEYSHSSLIFRCHLCDRHVFSRASMTKHMLTMHKAIYQSGADKNSLWSETDLTSYSVKNSQGTQCPKCKIKYPNLRALKIHYLKYHEKT